LNERDCTGGWEYKVKKEAEGREGDKNSKWGGGANTLMNS